MAPAILLSLVALLFSACGGGADQVTITSAPPNGDPLGPVEQPRPDVTGDADPAAIDVINNWAKALTEGEIGAAAEYFAIPSVAENGPTLRITNRAQARLFNATLPCGAVLVNAEGQGDFTTATFRLTERPGPGVCGPGVDGEAQTAFVIENGEIVEWRRVAVDGTRPAPGEAV